MIGTVLRESDLALWVVGTACVIVVASGMVTGYRVHRWLVYSLPLLGQRLPIDAGAWVGLAAGITAAYFALG